MIDIHRSDNYDYLIDNDMLSPSPIKFTSLEKKVRLRFSYKYRASKFRNVPNEMVIDALMYSKSCHYIALFNEYLIWDYKDEFLKRPYNNQESLERIPKFADFYKNYLKFFCTPTFRNFDFNEIIQDQSEQKAEIFYHQNFGKNSKKNKEKKHDNAINNIEDEEEENEEDSENDDDSDEEENSSVLEDSEINFYKQRHKNKRDHPQLFNASIKKYIDNDSIVSNTLFYANNEHKDLDGIDGVISGNLKETEESVNLTCGDNLLMSIRDKISKNNSRQVTIMNLVQTMNKKQQGKKVKKEKERKESNSKNNKGGQGENNSNSKNVIVDKKKNNKSYNHSNNMNNKLTNNSTSVNNNNNQSNFNKSTNSNNIIKYDINGNSTGFFSQKNSSDTTRTNKNSAFRSGNNPLTSTNSTNSINSNNVNSLNFLNKIIMNEKNSKSKNINTNLNNQKQQNANKKTRNFNHFNLISLTKSKSQNKLFPAAVTSYNHNNNLNSMNNINNLNNLNNMNNIDCLPFNKNQNSKVRPPLSYNQFLKKANQYSIPPSPYSPNTNTNQKRTLVNSNNIINNYNNNLEMIYKRNGSQKKGYSALDKLLSHNVMKNSSSQAVLKSLRSSHSNMNSNASNNNINNMGSINSNNLLNKRTNSIHTKHPSSKPNDNLMNIAFNLFLINSNSTNQSNNNNINSINSMNNINSNNPSSPNMVSNYNSYNYNSSSHKNIKGLNGNHNLYLNGKNGNAINGLANPPNTTTNNKNNIKNINININNHINITNLNNNNNNSIGHSRNVIKSGKVSNDNKEFSTFNNSYKRGNNYSTSTPKNKIEVINPLFPGKTIDPYGKIKYGSNSNMNIHSSKSKDRVQIGKILTYKNKY